MTHVAEVLRTEGAAPDIRIHHDEPFEEIWHGWVESLEEPTLIVLCSARHRDPSVVADIKNTLRSKDLGRVALAGVNPQRPMAVLPGLHKRLREMRQNYGYAPPASDSIEAEIAAFVAENSDGAHEADALVDHMLKVAGSTTTGEVPAFGPEDSIVSAPVVAADVRAMPKTGGVRHGLVGLALGGLVVFAGSGMSSGGGTESEAGPEVVRQVAAAPPQPAPISESVAPKIVIEAQGPEPGESPTPQRDAPPSEFAPVLQAVRHSRARVLDDLMYYDPKTVAVPWRSASRRCKRSQVAGLWGWRLPTKAEAVELRRARFIDLGNYWTDTRGDAEGRSSIMLEYAPGSVQFRARDKQAVANPVCVRPLDAGASGGDH